MSSASGPPHGFDLRHHSKIASLSEETLAHIFNLGAATETQHPYAFRNSTSFPLIVSHVCRFWRVVALGTSRLWSKIFICDTFELSDISKSECGSSQITCRTEATCLRRIQAFLERSKSSRLALYIDVRSPAWFFRPNDEGNLFTAEHMSVLLDHLLPHMYRWEDVEIISDAWEPFATFLERCSRSRDHNAELEAKSLRRLSLIRTNAYVALESSQPSSKSNIFITPFESTPALRCVELAGVHLNWARDIPRNLTELTLKYHARHVLPTAAQLVDIINSSPRLETLSLHGWGIRSFEDGSSRLEGQVSLKNIKSLSIGWIDALYCRRLLSLFLWHFPMLESITLEDVRNSLDPLSEQDSSCVLEYVALRSLESDNKRRPLAAIELVLNSVYASLDSLQHLMEALPHSRSLTLHNVNDLLLSFLDTLQDSKIDTWSFPELSRVIVRTSTSESEAKVQQIAHNLMTVSPRRVVLEVEDLLELDGETESCEEDILENGSIYSFQHDTSSFCGDDLWIDPAADETSNEEGMLYAAAPYAFRDCVYTKSADL